MRFLLLAGLIFAADQLSKLTFQHFMFPGQSIPIIPNVFHLTLCRNPGAAFGILADKTEFFIIITIAVMALIVYLYRQMPKEKTLVRTALALQFGGALGNFVDRIVFGSVIDFLDFRVWPVFNLADSAIVVGIILLSIEIIKWREEDSKEHNG